MNTPKKKKHHAMVDIESLSNKPDGAIIAIGLCLFNADEIVDSAEILIDPRIAIGHRDPDTIAWWKSQDSEVFRKMMSGFFMPWEACEEFDAVFHRWKPKTIWANPPTFDISMLRHLFTACNYEFPMHFSTERDYRTIRKIADSFGIDYKAPYEEREAHDAKEDAICQAKVLQIMMYELELSDAIS